MIKNMKVMFVNTYPSPYRVDFFNLLSSRCNLTVCYELQSLENRNQKWVGNSNGEYVEKFLKCKPIKYGTSFSLSLVEDIKKSSYDMMIFANYVSPTVFLAIIYCKLHNIKYNIEYDGWVEKKPSKLKNIIKKALLIDADYHFTTSEQHKKYLESLGIDSKHIFVYPFSSVFANEVREFPVNDFEKEQLKKKLNIENKKIILSVGQFIYRKGFDVLIKAASLMRQDAQIYIIGDEPTNEYKEMVSELKLNNICFVGFKEKKDLRSYYEASDIFVLPTREDFWGLVVNEAMAAGLPVIATDGCVAAKEMITDGINGFIVRTGDPNELAEKIDYLLENESLMKKMKYESLRVANNYTLESMTEAHIKAFEMIKKSDEVRSV